MSTHISNDDLLQELLEQRIARLHDFIQVGLPCIKAANGLQAGHVQLLLPMTNPKKYGAPNEIGDLIDKIEDLADLVMIMKEQIQQVAKAGQCVSKHITPRMQMDPRTLQLIANSDFQADMKAVNLQAAKHMVCRAIASTTTWITGKRFAREAGVPRSCVIRWRRGQNLSCAKTRRTIMLALIHLYRLRNLDIHTITDWPSYFSVECRAVLCALPPELAPTVQMEHESSPTRGAMK